MTKITAAVSHLVCLPKPPLLQSSISFQKAFLSFLSLQSQKTIAPCSPSLLIKPVLSFPRKSSLLIFHSILLIRQLLCLDQTNEWNLTHIHHLDRIPNSGLIGRSSWAFQCKRHCFILSHTIVSKGLNYPVTRIFQPQWSHSFHEALAGASLSIPLLH